MRSTHLGLCAWGLALAALLAACAGRAAVDDPASLIPATLSTDGDAAKGADYFAHAGGCAACHTTGRDQLVGPGLAGVMTAAGPTHTGPVTYGGNLPNRQPRTEANIAAWIRAGGQGQVGTMAPHTLDDAQMADLLAYLRTLK